MPAATYSFSPCGAYIVPPCFVLSIIFLFYILVYFRIIFLVYFLSVFAFHIIVPSEGGNSLSLFLTSFTVGGERSSAKVSFKGRRKRGEEGRHKVNG